MKNNIIDINNRLVYWVHEFMHSSGFVGDVEMQILDQLSTELLDNLKINSKVSEEDYNELRKALMNMFMVGGLRKEIELNKK